MCDWDFEMVLMGAHKQDACSVTATLVPGSKGLFEL